MKLPLTATALVCVGAAGIAVGALVLEPASPSAAPAPAPVAPVVSTAAPVQPPAGYGTTVAGAPATAAPATAAPPAAAAAEIRDFAFATSPVAPAAVVTVTNRDDAGHTLTANAFDTGTIDGGGSATFTAPSAPGSYSIVCLIHPSMTGTLVVG